MKNSFKIFSVIVGLLVILIILRLNSISYPGDIAGNSVIIYLEEFHGYGGLFDIHYKNGRFLLKPFTGNIKLKGSPALKTVEIGDNDLITVETRKFLFNVFPRAATYKEVFRRPLRGIFPTPASKAKFIGGWTTTDGKRERILSRENDRELLKRLLVEIGAAELKKIMIDENTFDGKLLELKPSESDPFAALRARSPHIPIGMIRKWRERRIKKNTPFDIRGGDILKIPYRQSQPGKGLFIKFDFTRVRAVDYLAISYKEKVRPSRPGEQGGREIAFLKSLDTGLSFNINKDKKNAFIGGSGLFSFTLHPGQLLDKLYIPGNIPEGGVTDIKELLDRRLYYRQGSRFFPVTREFLRRLKKALGKKSKEEIPVYFEKNKITWREFDDYDEFKDFSKTAAALIKKMENKGIYRTFSREIAKLNDTHRILGIGLGVEKRHIEKVYYKIPGHTWLNANQVWENTPIVGGIGTFYWGGMIKEGDEPVVFKIRLKKHLPSLRLVAAADYGYSPDGKNYKKKNFFDGVQTLALAPGKKELFIKVWNLKSFNRAAASTNFQAEFILKNPPGESVRLVTDHTWEASVNTVHWAAALVNPSYGRPEPSAPHLDSLWYYEQWNPLYRGIKSRYFRKKFRLKEIPASVSWKIFASGNYILRVNRRVIRTEEDFIKALKKGANRVTVMVSRKGYRKYFNSRRMFTLRDHRILLKQKQVFRASFRKAREVQRPFISDINNTPLAYSSTINGKTRRFYTPGVQTELLSFFGDYARGTWGLEQIFSKPPRENKDEEKITGLQLTLNREWQTIALETMKKMLHANREKELNNPEYKKLKIELAAAEKQLQEKRRQLSTAGGSDGAPAQELLMQAIIALQNKIEDLKEQIAKIKNYFYEASVVLMGPKGEIFTAASYPYDDETMKALNPAISQPYRPGENPYFNRAWKWKYNPGSTVKILDAVSFLYSRDRKDERGRYLFPYLRRLLTRRSSFKNFPRLDLKKSTMLNGREIPFHLRNFQGIVIPGEFCTLQEALAHSYNTYFSYLALHNNRMLTVDSRVYDFEEEREKYKTRFISRANIPISRTYREYPLLQFAEKLFMNRKIDLLHNLKQTAAAVQLARLPNDAFMAVPSHFPVNAYTSANVAHYSIGQGNFQLTALQNALIVSTILNRGILYHPSIIKSAVLTDPGKDENLVVFDPEGDKTRVFPAAVAGQIKEAMKEVVNIGSARGLFLELKGDRQFYAKTGTAETELYKDNSLFTGFVIFRDGTPLIFSVIVPRSGLGARVAGKLTEEFLSAIIAHEDKKGAKL